MDICQDENVDRLDGQSGEVLCGLVVGVEVDDSMNVSLAVERDEL